MHLVFDIGNTLCKAAFFNNNKIVEKYSAAYSIQFIAEMIVSNPDTKRLYSTVISHNSADICYFTENMILSMNQLSHLPIKIKYKTPETLGEDRLAAICGARFLSDKKAEMLVVQVGTAFTFDYVNKNNEYLGGAISPGLDLRLKSLHNFTGKLPLLEKIKEFENIGNSTKGSIISGVMNGSLAEIQYRIDLFKKENPEGEIFLSGGDSSYFVNSLKSDIFAAENLVLFGLNYLLNLNA